MLSGTCSFAFRQNTTHGGQPTVQFYSSTKACTCHRDCGIPNMYNKTYVDILIADIYNDIYIQNIDLSTYYMKVVHYFQTCFKTYF